MFRGAEIAAGTGAGARSGGLVSGVGRALGDGAIDLEDLLLVLGNFGECGGEPNYPALADLDNDGCVELDDLLEILGGLGG